MSRSTTLLNYGLYQVGWICAVLGAAAGRPWSGAAAALALIVAHVWLAEHRRDEAGLALTAGAVGLVADSLPSAAGLLAFPNGGGVPWLCAPWVVVLWMQFGTTFRFSVRWLATRPALAAAAGVMSGPLVYVVGERLGAVTIGEPRVAALAMIGAAWSLALPVLAHASHSPEPGRYRILEGRGRAAGRPTAAG